MMNLYKIHWDTSSLDNLTREEYFLIKPEYEKNRNLMPDYIVASNFKSAMENYEKLNIKYIKIKSVDLICPGINVLITEGVKENGEV